MTGMIRTLHNEKGFGFIRELAGRDYFFHRTAVADEGFEDLRSGNRVEFDIGDMAKGPRAEKVQRARRRSPRRAKHRIGRCVHDPNGKRGV